MSEDDTAVAGAEHPALLELQSALAFYDRKGVNAKKTYQSLRVATMMLAATIPVVAALDGSPAISAVLGSAIVVIEGLQQLFQFHNRWIDYRAAWNSLERERRLFQSRAGPYTASNAARILAERTEAIIGLENSDWVADEQAVTSGGTSTAGI